jgi:uncharacterized protein YjbJ (UPF0337 family)
LAFFVPRFLALPPALADTSLSNPVEVNQMGLLDRLLGRGKKAAGDMTGDASMRREGAAQEREGAAEDRAAQHEEMAQEQRNQAAEAHAEREDM